MRSINESVKVDFVLNDPAVAKSPGEFFSHLRDKCPVAHSDAHGGFWLLSRYDDVHRAALNAETFSSAAGITIPPGTYPPLLCVEQDNPGHRKFRRPMNSWFSPRRMSELEQPIRQLVSELIDAVVEDGQCDVVAVLAQPVPAIVVGMLLGLPEKDWTWFREQNQISVQGASNGDYEHSSTASSNLVQYLAAQLDQRRARPADDLLSEIVKLEVDGQPVGMEQAISLAYLLLSAGHETTVGALGGMLYHIARDPALRDRLLEDPSLIPATIEESLRLEPPVPGMGRITVCQAEIGDVTVPAGERLMLMFGAANRDPEVFTDPEEFQLGRPDNRHLSFGVGIHRCVGAPLAKIEMQIVLEEVLRRMPGIRLASEQGATATYHFTRAFSTLPVTW
jgi:cytochrome P450